MFFQQNFVSGCDELVWVGRVLMGGGLVNVVRFLNIIGVLCLLRCVWVAFGFWEFNFHGSSSGFALWFGGAFAGVGDEYFFADVGAGGAAWGGEFGVGFS